MAGQYIGYGLGNFAKSYEQSKEGSQRRAIEQQKLDLAKRQQEEKEAGAGYTRDPEGAQEYENLHNPSSPYNPKYNQSATPGQQITSYLEKSRNKKGLLDLPEMDEEDPYRDFA